MKHSLILLTALLLAPLHAVDAPSPQLWDTSKPMPKVAELATIPGARFSIIKPYEFSKDGYRFLHGVALCFHKGKLYASDPLTPRRRSPF